MISVLGEELVQLLGLLGAASPADQHPHRTQLLLYAVVQVALDAAAFVVDGVDDVGSTTSSSSSWNSSRFPRTRSPDFPSAEAEADRTSTRKGVPKRQ